MTARTPEEADLITFSPLWRANWQAANAEVEPALRSLQKQVNARINASSTPGRIRWTHRLFRRGLDDSAEEWGRIHPKGSLVKIADHPAGYLPAGLLAEPFESVRKELEGSLARP